MVSLRRKDDLARKERQTITYGGKEYVLEEVEKPEPEPEPEEDYIDYIENGVKYQRKVLSRIPIGDGFGLLLETGAFVYQEPEYERKRRAKMFKPPGTF